MKSHGMMTGAMMEARIIAAHVFAAQIARQGLRGVDERNPCRIRNEGTKDGWKERTEERRIEGRIDGAKCSCPSHHHDLPRHSVRVPRDPTGSECPPRLTLVHFIFSVPRVYSLSLTFRYVDVEEPEDAPYGRCHSPPSAGHEARCCCCRGYVWLSAVHSLRSIYMYICMCGFMRALWGTGSLALSARATGTFCWWILLSFPTASLSVSLSLSLSSRGVTLTPLLASFFGPCSQSRRGGCPRAG